MILARVLGNVVATVKHPSLHSQAVFAVQPLDEAQQPSGDSFWRLIMRRRGPATRC